MDLSTPAVVCLHDGQLFGHPVLILLDSGAEDSYVSETFVRTHRLRPVTTSAPPAMAVDGHLLPTLGRLKPSVLRLGPVWHRAARHPYHGL